MQTQQQDTVTKTFGIISYLRNFFSEDAFTTVKDDNVNLKILKETKQTQKLIFWINEIKANQNNIYKIMIGIYKNLKSKKELIEIYSFKVNEKIDYKEICKTLQKMEVLNGSYSMKLKIFTYSKVQISGFKDINELWEIGNKKEVEIKGMKLLYKSKIDESINNNSNPINDVSNYGNSNIIECACTINTNEKDMILCKLCMKWSHVVCYGYFSSKDKRIPLDFKCYFCSGEIDHFIRDSCIYRRVLWIVFNEEPELTDLYFCERLQLTKNFSKKLVCKLRKDKIVKSNSATKLNTILRNTEVKEKIKEYFNGSKLDCCISEDEIRNN